jgi:hypothetical protein
VLTGIFCYFKLTIFKVVFGHINQLVNYRFIVRFTRQEMLLRKISQVCLVFPMYKKTGQSSLLSLSFFSHYLFKKVLPNLQMFYLNKQKKERQNFSGFVDE